jgi:uncharacterized membrane protein YoaK (UPF0700 family)
MPDQRVPSDKTPAPTYSLSTFLDVVVLAIVAGSADAAGYLGLGKVFTSNMTGNVVLLGIALSEGRSEDTGRSLFALLAFIVGTSLGSWFYLRVARNMPPAAAITRVIKWESGLLWAYAILSELFSPEQRAVFTYPLIGLLGLSMGLQSVAFYRLGVSGVASTAVTGTLTILFAGLVKSVSDNPSPASREIEEKHASFALQTLVILTYCGGAAVSGVLMLHARTWAGFFPATLVAFVVVNRLFRRA